MLSNQYLSFTYISFQFVNRYGLLYLLLFTLQAMLLPEPTYKGPESIIYFRATGLDEELSRDPRVTWLVTFYAAWSPSCVNFSPVFSQLSAQYALPNLKFGKLFSNDKLRYKLVLSKIPLFLFLNHAIFSF